MVTDDMVPTTELQFGAAQTESRIEASLMFNVGTFYFALCVICCVHRDYGYETTNSLELYPPWTKTYRYVNENYRVVCKCIEAYHDIKWIKVKEGPVREGGKIVYTRSIQKGIALVFTNITKEVEGEYECVAFDKSENITYMNKFTLSVREPIVFDGPVLYEAVIDETVFLKCEVNEKLALKRHWEFKGKLLPPVERFREENEGIRIAEVGLGDAGKYYCVISHWPFQSTSNRLEITLIVYYKPVPRSISNSTIYGFVDEVVSITCEVSANPNPWFIWYDMNRKPLDPKNDKVNITVQNDTSVLKVLLTEPIKETFYICEACNELGCLEQNIHVKKTTKLRIPVLGLWDIDSDSAEFYVSTQADASLYIFQYFFDVEDDIQWGTPFEKNFSTVLPRAKMDSYMRYEVDELHPDTNYILRVASANQFTKSDFSEERRFKTRLGRTIHTICNESSCRRICSILLLLPFINVISLKNIFH